VSIGKLGLWVKGKTSEHIVVMDKRVQRILAIEARAGQVDGSSMKQKLIFLRASPFTLSRNNGIKGSWRLTPIFLLQVEKMKGRVEMALPFFLF